MGNKAKKKIVTQRRPSEGQMKRNSGKPKGIKQNILPLSGQWCEDTNLKNLIIDLTKVGRINNYHTTTPSQQSEKRLKNSIIKELARICGRFQKFQGNLVFFFNTKFEQQSLDIIYEEIDLYGDEINKILIEKLGQMLELRFIKEIIHYIRSKPKKFIQDGSLEKQFQIVQAMFVKYLEQNINGAEENIDIQARFEEFKATIDEQKEIQEIQQIQQIQEIQEIQEIHKIYERIAPYFLKKVNSFENESKKILEVQQHYEHSFN